MPPGGVSSGSLLAVAGSILKEDFKLLLMSWTVLGFRFSVQSLDSCKLRCAGPIIVAVMAGVIKDFNEPLHFMELVRGFSDNHGFHFFSVPGSQCCLPLGVY